MKKTRREFIAGGLATLALLGAGCEPIPDPSSESETQEDTANEVFAAGVNLPWVNYGYDIGSYPGFAQYYNLGQSLDYLKSKNVNLIRTFFHCDLRSGLELASNGDIIGLNSYVNPNIQEFLDQVDARDMKVLPVYFDFHIANGIQYENNWRVGEHPDFLTSKKAQFLEKIVRPVTRDFGNHNAIYALDIINEPKYAVETGTISKSDMKSFIQDCANVIKQETSKPVCFGAHDPDSLNDYDNPHCDLAQVHYWHGWDMYNTLASDISSKPVLIGETEPLNVTAKLNAAFANGYQGLLFWRDSYYDFRPVADEFSNWVGAQ